MFKDFLWGMALLACGTAVQAQPDSLTSSLPEITVSATSLRSSMTGEHREDLSAEIRVLPAASNLAQVLSSHGSIYVKNYGPGTLATISMRGASAQQTTVFWNGIPLLSPMAGLNDLALIPVQWMDEAAIHYGAGSAQWGSGAVGGSIAFAQQIPEKKGFQGQIKAQTGSFAAQQYQLIARYRSSRWALSTRAFTGKSVNDFPWHAQPNTLPRRQTNAAQQQQGILKEIWFIPAQRHQLALFSWLQHNYRQIPPLSTQLRSSATQDDQSWRNILQWRYAGTTHFLQAKAAWFNEHIDYRERAEATPALSHFQTAFAEVEETFSLSRNWRIQAVGNITRAQATADGYREGVSEMRSAVWINVRRDSKRWQNHLSLRQEWIGLRSAPLLPGAGASWQWTPYLKLKARLNRHYRLPTLNDRFWQPGGNAELKPEQGWSKEVGWEAILFKMLRWETAVYHRLMRDWILWSQAPGQPYWSSNNITSVRSYGVEHRLYSTFHIGPTTWQVRLNYDFTRSVNQMTLPKPLLLEGAQLWYVPVHQAGATTAVNWHGWGLSYQHHYTGPTIGFGEKLSSFDLGTMQLQYQSKGIKRPITAFFQVDNLWNVSYRIVERRPMPGRSWTIGLAFQ